MALGLGIGVVMPLLNVAVQNAFPYRMMGMVSATQQFVRSLGRITVFAMLAFLATLGLKELELQQDEFFQEQQESVNILE